MILPVLQVTLDLKGPSALYAPLYAYLQSYPWSHYLSTTWFIETPKEPLDIVEDLRKFMQPADLCYIAKVQWPCSGLLPKPAWDWLSLRCASGAECPLTDVGGRGKV